MTDLAEYAQGNSDFLKKEELPPPPAGIRATISHFGRHRWPGDDVDSVVMHFREPNIKPLCCNKTNLKILFMMFGTSIEEDLVDNTVELFNDVSVVMNGKVGGVRIRPSTSTYPPQTPQYGHPPAQAAPAPQPTVTQQPPAAPQPMGQNVRQTQQRIVDEGDSPF